MLSIENPKDGSLERCKDTGTKEACLLGDLSVKPSIAILGDSHSGVLGAELSYELEKLSLSAISYEERWCVPLIDVGTTHKLKNPACRAYIKNAYTSILNNDEIKNVILVAEWSNYTKGYRWNDAGVAYYTDSFSNEESVEENIRAIKRGLIRTLEALKSASKSIIVVKSVPEYTVLVPKLLAMTYLLPGSIDVRSNAVDKVVYSTRNAEIEEIFKDININKLVSVVDTFAIFCPNSSCQYASDLGAYYIDGNHLSRVGSKVLVPHILQQIKNPDQKDSSVLPKPTCRTRPDCDCSDE